MTEIKTLGICMDHASARIMDYTAGVITSSVINSKFTHLEKTQSLEKGEHLSHNKEQHELAAYYKALGEVIKRYDVVLLFGATSAKVELYNVLKKDHHFDKIQFDIKQTDRMTENQQEAFITDHFSASGDEKTDQQR